MSAIEHDWAIRVEKVSKDFLLPQERANSVKSLVTGLSRRRKNKAIKTQHALHDVSFEIQKGEFFGIVGRNGGGKSTILKILAGIYQPTKGKVHTKGKLVPFIELGVGFNPELTGRENVYLNGAMLGFSRKEIDLMYNDIVSFAELERFMDQKLKNYSSGMQVRLAFSMAIRSDADILLIDEVLAVGDADFQRKCFDYFQRLKGSDTTVVFISHNMNDIREYCNRALLIDKSKVVDMGEPGKIAKQYSQLFIETAKGPQASANSKRWGNQALRYSEFTVTPTILTDGQNLVIEGSLTAKRDLDANCLIGFSIKNSGGQALVGSNNLLAGQPLGALKKNQHLTFRWELANVFSDGNYEINATCSLANGEESDWWDAAASFNVLLGKEHAPYLVSPPLALRLSPAEPSKSNSGTAA